LNMLDEGIRIVHAFGCAPHQHAKAKTWFTPRRNEEYLILYKLVVSSLDKVYSLQLYDLQLHYVVHDDVEWNLRTNYAGLMKADIMPKTKENCNVLHDQFFLKGVEALALQSVPTGQSGHDVAGLKLMDTLLRQHGLTTSTLGLRVILNILQEFKAYALREGEDYWKYTSRMYVEIVPVCVVHKKTL
jgi:hypothetical protein